MADSTDVFKNVPQEDETKLLEMLRKNISSIHVLCFAMNVIELKKNIPGIKAGICSPNGDYSESTVLVYFNEDQMLTITYYSETAAGCSRLRNALATTNLFRDSSYVLISAVHDRIYKSVGTDWCHLNLDHVTTCDMYGISCEKALAFNYECPEDVYVRRLVPEDAELIHSLWPHGVDGSVELIRQIIMISPSCGLYRKSDNKLLSWSLKWITGALGILQTVEEAKRKGYAQIVVAELSKQCARDNWPISGPVIVKNFKSKNLLEGMGFSKYFLCHYIDFIRAPFQ